MRVVPLGLALALIAIVVLAGVLPGTGIVSASSNCSYGTCPASSPFPYWAIGAAAAVVVVALLAALLLLRRRRPPTGTSGPTQDGTSPEGAPEPGGDSGTPSTWDETPSSEAPPASPEGSGAVEETSGGPSP